MKRAALFFLVLFSAPFLMMAESARAIVDRAVVESASGEKTIRAILIEVDHSARLAEGADKRALYAFLGSLNEQVGNYEDASRDFATAAGIVAGDSPGMPRYTADQLVINAVRCALSSGDNKTADNYLASRVKNSQDPTILAYVKLYSLWSRLSVVETGRDLKELMMLLRSYAKDPAMEAVRPAVLLSIWYIDDDQESAGLLVSRYPQSPEAAIVQNRVTLLPAPFWYFSPRNTLAGVPKDADIPLPVTPGAVSGNSSGTDQSVTPGMYQQLGRFRNAANALRLVDEASGKGFFPILRSTLRDGETFYVVLVPENAGRTMGERLKAAGYDCFPVYE